eukprot:2702545-Rhodomonas_salina.2
MAQVELNCRSSEGRKTRCEKADDDAVWNKNRAGEDRHHVKYNEKRAASMGARRKCFRTQMGLQLGARRKDCHSQRNLCSIATGRSIWALDALFIEADFADTRMRM